MFNARVFGVSTCERDLPYLFCSRWVTCELCYDLVHLLRMLLKPQTVSPSDVHFENCGCLHLLRRVKMCRNNWLAEPKNTAKSNFQSFQISSQTSSISRSLTPRPSSSYHHVFIFHRGSASQTCARPNSNCSSVIINAMPSERTREITNVLTPTHLLIFIFWCKVWMTNPFLTDHEKAAHTR